MISDLALKDPSIEDTKQADENLKHQEAKQAEGDDLQVKLSSQVKHKSQASQADQSSRRLFDVLQLRLMLPDGKEELIPAKLGQTVQYTKAVLHERFGLPMDKQVAAAQACFISTCRKLLGSYGESLQKLICEGRPMLDPLSLVDCKGISSSGLNLIQVQVVEAHGTCM